MIITRLNGGLGNQMFEYAHARNLQLKNNDSLYLDISGFDAIQNGPKRSYSLGNFVLDESVRILPKNESKNLTVFQAVSKFDRELGCCFAKVFNIYMWKSNRYKDLNVGETKNRSCYFYGYWQSELYFKENADVICKELKVKSEPTEECKKYLDLINNSEALCVHIRRGDYVKSGMISCDSYYYVNGINHILRYKPDSEIFVFSDDSEWVKQNISFPKEVVYVDVPGPDYEVLRLMYSCKNFVISNSSYSWWAQYLSENTDKIVVAPEIWYPNVESDESIYQKNWVVI